jgi:tRNA 2-thiouridine synthesizing protein A
MSILTQTVDRELDTKGLSCPLPILKTKKTLAEMTSGQTIRVVASDAGSVRDFQAFAKQTGNVLVGQMEDGANFVHLMQRK